MLPIFSLQTAQFMFKCHHKIYCTTIHKGGVSIMICEQLIKKKQQLENQISSLDIQISHLPSNDFYIGKNGKYDKWYETDGKTQTYIPKSMQTHAEKLATKKYLSLLREDLSHDINAIDFLLKHYKNGRQAEKLLAEKPSYQKLIAPFFKPDSKDLQHWMTSSYERNPLYPEQLIHKTTSGNQVRSKSEAIIDTLLYMNKIPFRYECALPLNNTIFYPDFTIRHPLTGNIFYWEHFGMMDNSEYSDTAIKKIKKYISSGFIPNIHLITTFETKDFPLTTEQVQQIIELYFL